MLAWILGMGRGRLIRKYGQVTFHKNLAHRSPIGRWLYTQVYLRRKTHNG